MSNKIKEIEKQDLIKAINEVKKLSEIDKKYKSD